MVFSSEIFLFFFLPITLIIYALCSRRIKLRNYVLLAASIIFYSWGGVSYCILILISTIVNYILGRLMEQKRLYGKIFLWGGVFYNVAILGVFKYSGFIVDCINTLLKKAGSSYEVPDPQIALPIGISFFTFQILSYIIDVYFGKVKVQKNIWNLYLYIMLFPQLIAGPIVRYADIEQEIENRVFSLEGFYTGIRRFCIGFSKKVLLANQVAVIADTAFAYEGGLHPFYAWMGAISYMLQIYLDFSAYSDMAIGLGCVFGFHFNENFMNPYISTSIKEFWRRWHISLSTWFRDYVYIPLGGNRKGTFCTYRNLLTVFFLTGLWHGASWNFIIWGLYHGFFLLLERVNGFCKKIPKWLSYIYTMLVVLFGWVLFRADNLEQAVQYMGDMFGKHSGNINNVFMIRRLDMQYFFFLAFSVIVSTPFQKRLGSFVKQEWLKDAMVLGVFFIAVCYMVASDYNPFIYFRF